jgi:caa(3)-type oxidase subunit IV
MASSPEEIRKHAKAYWVVGCTLCLFTVITVLLSIVPAFDLGAPGRGPGDIALALCIATFKASLVMLIFMHLRHERGVIYKALAFTAVFAAALMVLSLFAQADPVRLRPTLVNKNPAIGPAPRVILEVNRGKP